MKYFLLILVTLTLQAGDSKFFSKDYHKISCEANHTHRNCYSPALGGTNGIKQQRIREVDDNYYDLDHYRIRPGQDLEDMRESL